MKRLFAIVILNIFLLNVLGYYGVLLGMKISSGEQLAERLNSDMYDLGGTVTFKVPLSIPYGTDSKGYEKADGAFEKDGVAYRMVKQRYYQDALYILCIKDEETTRINDSLADFVQSFAGLDDDGQQKTASQGFIKDYVNSEVTLTSSVKGWENDVASPSVSRNFIDSYFASIVHPPDRA